MFVRCLPWRKTQKFVVCILLSILSHTWNIAAVFQGPGPVTLNVVQTEIKGSICSEEIRYTIRQDLNPPGELSSCWVSGWPRRR